MRRTWSIVLMEARLFARTPQAAFWTFFFPVFLLALLGSVFGRTREHIEFLIPGLLGMALASTSYYSVGVAVTQYRSSGLLKRLALIPIPSWQFVAAQMLVRAGVVLAVGAELVVMAWMVFGARPAANPFTLGVVLAVGIPAFLASGFAVGVLAPSVESAGSLASVLFLPMTFLSGAYFPTDRLPAVLEHLAAALPLTYFLHGLRQAVAGAGLRGVAADLAVLTAWGAVGTAVSVARFRWTT